MDLMDSLAISAAGLRVQGERLRVISENIANADSVSEVRGGDPYRRKTISFQNELDRQSGLDLVKVRKVGLDPSEFTRKYDPPGPEQAGDAWRGFAGLSNYCFVLAAKDRSPGTGASPCFLCFSFARRAHGKRATRASV